MGKLVLVAVMVFLAGFGCASSGQEQRADETATQEQALSPQAMCPMAVEGTTVRAEDTSDGAALVFTTTGDKAELRKRLRAMTEMHGKMRDQGGACGCPCGMEPGPGGGKGHGSHGSSVDHPGPAELRDAMHAEAHGGGSGPHGGHGGMHGEMTPEMHAGMMAMKQAQVRMEETEGGGRLVFTPTDPAQLPALRQAVQARAAMMATGGCPMMKKGPPPAGSAE